MGTPKVAYPLAEDGLIPYCLPCLLKVIAGDDLTYVEHFNLGEHMLIDTD
jgi:hypothetical protein